MSTTPAKLNKMPIREVSIQITYSVNEKGEKIVNTTFGHAPLSLLRAMLRQAAEHTNHLQFTSQS